MEKSKGATGREFFRLLTRDFNPYHDKRGRFTSPGGGGISTFSANPDTPAGKRAIEREELRLKEMAAKFNAQRPKPQGLSMPEFSGTEKQKSFAKSIVEEPYKNLEAAAKGFERTNTELGGKSDYLQKQAQACRSAQESYATLVLNLKGARSSIPAGEVIDKKIAFRQAAKQLLQKEWKAAGASGLPPRL